MLLFQQRNTEAVKTLLAAIKDAAKQAQTLQEASQQAMDQVYTTCADSLVLARTYATMPFSSLPERDRSFVQALAKRDGIPYLISPGTPVLSLLGTAGVEPAWCNRYRSRGHLGIPLLSKEFVESIPMVAALTHQVGKAVDWYGGMRSPTDTERFGVFAESFFVADVGHPATVLGDCSFRRKSLWRRMASALWWAWEGSLQRRG